MKCSTSLFGCWETTDSLLRGTVNTLVKFIKRLTCSHPLKSPELEHCLSCKSKTYIYTLNFQLFFSFYDAYHIIEMEGRFTNLEHGFVTNFVVWRELWICGLIMVKPMTASAMFLNESGSELKCGSFGCYFGFWWRGRESG